MINLNGKVQGFFTSGPSTFFKLTLWFQFLGRNHHLTKCQKEDTNNFPKKQSINIKAI